MSGIIAVSAVVAMASVLLVFQMGQPRIWMSMSRDGLLPKRYSRVHPKFKTLVCDYCYRFRGCSSGLVPEFDYGDRSV
jgi:hypothetical protein